MTLPQVAPPRQVLVVEDDDDVREIIVEILEHAGIEVASAMDGEDALEQLAPPGRRAPDAILLDVMMPGLDGAGFLARLRALEGLARVPVVVMTAGGRRAEDLIPPGDVAAWLRKPFEFDGLLAVVVKAFSRATQPCP